MDRIFLQRIWQNDHRRNKPSQSKFRFKNTKIKGRKPNVVSWSFPLQALFFSDPSHLLPLFLKSEHY